MSEVYEKFKELRQAVANDGSWNGDSFVRSEEEEENIELLFVSIEKLLFEETR